MFRTENKILEAEFKIGCVNEIEEKPCWWTIDITDEENQIYTFSHCYCGLGDDIDLIKGDSLIKNANEMNFFNIRTQSELVLNCCSH